MRYSTGVSLDQPAAPLRSSGSNVCSFVLENCVAERTALFTSDGARTYAELKRGIEAAARLVAGNGAQKQDRVLVLADNSFFFICAYFGTMLAGCVAVPLNPSMASGELEHIVNTTQPAVAFTPLKTLAKHRASLEKVKVIVDKERRAAKHNRPQSFESEFDRREPVGVSWPETSDADLAAIMFTSGSTGRPRGVEITHRNIIANTRSIIEYLNLTPDDRIMTVLPLYYCFGASLLHTHLRAGASLVLDSRFMYPDKVLERMAETSCTGFAGVPSHFQILLRKSSLGRKPLPSLRYVQQAGGHLAPVFVKELLDALPDAEVFLMYGQTEATARLSYLDPSRIRDKMNSVGKPIPGVELYVVDEQGKKLAANQSGEIVARGDNVAHGYWREQDETRFRDGLLFTGDIGYFDDEGFFYIEERKSDFIKCGGERLSCQKLEESLLECPDVLEAVVIGVPDEILGEAVKAFIVPRKRNDPGLEERALNVWRQHVAFKHMPKHIKVLDSLPKSESGKILRRALRSL